MNEANLLSLLSFAGIASALGAIFLAVRDVFFRRPAAAGSLLRRLPRFEAEDSTSVAGRLDAWLERTLYLSGLEWSVPTATMIMLLLAVALGGGVYIATDNELLAGLSVMATWGAFLGYLEWSKRRQLKKFQDMFPEALDLLARAVRAGESLEQGIELIGESSSEPIGKEFRRCARQIGMGLSVPATMKAFVRRLGLMDVRIFANTLTVHRESGGNLPETLERLAAVIRDRMNYHRQLKSVTGAGRFSVVVIASLGPLLFGYLFLFQPEYGHRLWEDPIGRWALVYATVSQLLGLFVVSRLTKADY